MSVAVIERFLGRGVRVYAVGMVYSNDAIVGGFNMQVDAEHVGNEIMGHVAFVIDVTDSAFADELALG